MGTFIPTTTEATYETKSIQRLMKMRDAINEGYTVDYIAANNDNFIVLTESIRQKPTCLFLVFSNGDDVTFINCPDGQQYNTNVFGQIEVYLQDKQLVILNENKNGKFLLNHGFKKLNSKDFFLAYYYATKDFRNLFILDSSKNNFFLNTWEATETKFPCRDLFFYVCKMKFPDLKWEVEADDELPFI